MSSRRGRFGPLPLPLDSPLSSLQNHGTIMFCAHNAWVLTYENLSHIEPWLSDCLCVLSTGGGFSTRTLYTDTDETIFEAQRPRVGPGAAGGYKVLAQCG